MFSTALGQSRIDKMPAAVVLYLAKKVKESGADPDCFSLTTFKNPNNVEDDFQIRCNVCGHSTTQILCDWSKDYGLDGLITCVLDFTKNHKHGPIPVLDVQGTFKPVRVEHPKGYRKFREV